MKRYGIRIYRCISETCERDGASTRKISAEIYPCSEIHLYILIPFIIFIANFSCPHLINILISSPQVYSFINRYIILATYE
jgi:hypothetical protein